MKRYSVKVIVEIPKGNGRRIHLDYSRSFYIDLGPTRRFVPINNGIMPATYGFIPRTLTKEKDELDIVLYSKRKFKIGSRTNAYPIASLNRKDGDHKIIAVDDTMEAESWSEIPKKTRDLFIKYFGYNSPITKIASADDAILLIKRHTVKKPLKIPKKTIVKRLVE